MDTVEGYDETGLPDCPVEIINCGVLKELPTQNEIEELNKKISIYQFNDLKLR